MTEPLCVVIKKRIFDTTEWLKDNGPICFAEQKHLEEGTPERAYWHHGYLMALRDVLRQLEAKSERFSGD